MEKAYLHPDTTSIVHKGDGFFYLGFNAKRLKKALKVKTLDSQGSLYQHHIDDITNSIHETIQKSTSSVIFNPVNAVTYPIVLPVIVADVEIEALLIVAASIEIAPARTTWSTVIPLRTET